MNNDQARAIAGGLQAHSVGGTYPFCVVGIGNGDKTHFEVHNLQTDEVLSCGGVPAKFVYSGFARSVAEEASRLIGPGWTWVKRKPYVPEPSLHEQQARRATDGNTVEPPFVIPRPDTQTDWDRDGEGEPAYTVQAVKAIVAKLYKPAHGGYPGDCIAFQVPADTTGLFPGGDDDHWPAPGVSRYA